MGWDLSEEWNKPTYKRNKTTKEKNKTAYEKKNKYFYKISNLWKEQNSQKKRIKQLMKRKTFIFAKFSTYERNKTTYKEQIDLLLIYHFLLFGQGCAPFLRLIKNSWIKHYDFLLSCWSETLCCYFLWCMTVFWIFMNRNKNNTRFINRDTFTMEFDLESLLYAISKIRVFE